MQNSPKTHAAFCAGCDCNQLPPKDNGASCSVFRDFGGIKNAKQLQPRETTGGPGNRGMGGWSSESTAQDWDGLLRLLVCQRRSG
jgi:hypothetical protein